MARHTDVKMTMRYTHIGIQDQAKAVAKLPVPKSSPNPVPAAKTHPDRALQMRCISGGAEGHSLSADGNAHSDPEFKNPCQSKGLVADRRQLAAVVKAEGTGVESTSDFDAIDDGECGCEFCQGFRAARALHSGRSSWHDLALLDAGLQRIIAAWGSLPKNIRAAMMALAETAVS